MNTAKNQDFTTWPYMPEADYWLLEGAKAGNIAVIDEAMNEGARLDCRSRMDQHTPLELCAKEGHLKAMARLLDLEDKHGAPTPDSRSGALIMAALKGRSACVTELLSRGASTSPQMAGKHIKKYHKDRSALMWAIDGGYEECALLLIPTTSPHASCLDGTHAIHLAARKKMQSAIKALALSGAQIDARDRNGRTALHHACLSSSESCCQELIEQGARGNLDDQEGIPPWGYALFKAWKAGFELLSALDDLQTPSRLSNAMDFIDKLNANHQPADLKMHSGVGTPAFQEVMTLAKLWVQSARCKADLSEAFVEPKATSKTNKARL